MTDYIMTLRSIENGEFTDRPGATTFLALGDAEAAPFDPGKALAADQWVQQIVAGVPKQRDATGVVRGDVLVFIHGYNNSMEEVLKRHRLIKQNLPPYGFAGTVVSFDWPCGDIALAYIPDREQAKETAFALVRDGIGRLARMQSTFDCDINVHLLAHSTGAYVVQEAFDDADDRPAINSINWTVSQIAFISADLAASTMTAGNSETQSIYGHCVRLTNYSNAHDDVLQLSNVKRVGVEPRVGRIGLPPDAPPLALNVDCSVYYQTVVAPWLGPIAGVAGSHSWQFDNPVFACDLAQTLNGERDRSVITTRSTVTANRFALKFPDPPPAQSNN
jgi:pimeloyl-ACP methyl ester carboxylesterase